MSFTIFPFTQEETEYTDTPHSFCYFHQVFYNVQFIADRFERGVPKPRKEKNGTFVSNPHNSTERAKVFQKLVACFQKETATNISDKRQHSHPELFKKDVKQLIEYCNTCISIIEQDKEYYFTLITEPFNAKITEPTRPNWYEIVYNNLDKIKRSAELYLPKKGKTKELPTFEELFIPDFANKLINELKRLNIITGKNPPYTWHGKTDNMNELAAMFFVLKDKRKTTNKAKNITQSMKVIYKYFGMDATEKAPPGDVTIKNCKEAENSNSFHKVEIFLSGILK